MNKRKKKVAGKKELERNNKVGKKKIERKIIKLLNEIRNIKKTDPLYRKLAMQIKILHDEYDK